MGKPIRITVMVAIFALIAAAGAIAKPDVVRIGNLVIRDNGGITPTRLPRHEQAPISANLRASLGTTDGSHPPAVKSLLIDIDKTIHVNAKGLPVCRYGQLTNRSTADAKRACPHAIVGSGDAKVEVAFPDQKPFTGAGRLIAFNGGVRGGTTLLLVHAYVNIPAPTTVVAETKISRINRGHLGLHTVTQIPTIAAGDGSPTGFKLRLGRTFAYKGKKESYLTASCPTGHYFVKGKVQFADGTTAQLTHILPCTPAN